MGSNLFEKFKKKAEKGMEKIDKTFDYGQEDDGDRGIEGEGGDQPPEEDFNRTPPAQKSESFHHYVLENKYRDLERSIRGVKDVYNKTSQKFEMKRKAAHCFTDEEAEEILRTAQAHLSPDIKLACFTENEYKGMMGILYDELSSLFRHIAEYRYGRYTGYEKQLEMKLMNKKIFLELYNSIRANYSRAIKGTENKRTHEGVAGQENLAPKDNDGSSKGYF